MTPLDSKYSDWIKAKLETEDPFGKCSEWTLEMQAAFTELKRVRGQVMLSNLWERDHWWLVTPDGQTIDPTESQFSGEYFRNSKVVWYQPRDESEPEPTGKCPNCGGYCYTGDTCCSDRCSQQYAAYCMGVY